MYTYVYKSLNAYIIKSLHFFGCDLMWTVRKKFTRVLLVWGVPPRGQHNMWTLVVPSQ